MPRVVLAPSYGGPEVLTVVDRPAEPLTADTVRMAVRAAGVNPADWKAYGGTFGTDPAALPRRIGFEASGVVTEVGHDVVGVAVGDEVIAFRVAGAYADEIVVAPAALTPKPPSLSWEDAAGLMLTGATAEHLLAATFVGPGDTVLVHGAAGGVGQLAVQLAVLRGARVIGTAGPANADLIASLGGEPVRYGDGLADRVRALAPGGVQAALDCVGTDEALDVSLALVATRVRIATIANFTRGPQEEISVLGGGPGADSGAALRDAARGHLATLAGQGRLKLRSRAYPLADVAAAHRDGMDGHAAGKLVLVP